MMQDAYSDVYLVDKEYIRNTLDVENEMNHYMATDEGDKIKEDIELLNDMGYDKRMINKVYILLNPENIERAIEFMTEENGVYQHDFFESHNSIRDKDLCFICNKTRKYHLDYIPEESSADNLNLRNYIIEDNNLNNKDDSFSFSTDSIKDNSVKSEKGNLISNECNVCYDEIEENEKNFNVLPCGHLCCTQCWLNYLKTLITEAKVEKIKCVDHQCKQIISEEFILKHINNDQKLVDKYHKFKKRSEIINDKNKKQCPKPDCESYLENSSTSKYVKCKNGHEYCFECLKPPHGKTPCDEVVEKDFLKWKKHKRVKRCPRCKIFTEKNEGCNHMTCVSCKFQWCWLCEGQYSYDHYRTGKCKGHQFTKADSLKQANRRRCFCSLHSIFPCYFKRVEYPLQLDSLILEYLGIFIIWFFGIFLTIGFSMFFYTDRHVHINSVCPGITFNVLGFFIALSLYVCFQILFICLITPFMLVCLVHPSFISNILYFLCISK